MHAIGLDPEGPLPAKVAANQETFSNLISTEGTA